MGCRVHHLNCISSCPLGGRLMDERLPTVIARAELSCHCLLVETNDGLVLVDTGFGLGDVRAPRTRLSRFFLSLLKPALAEELTAVRQVARLGFAVSDVRHIVLTHLDFDHAGGLDDFPNAAVHMMRSECVHAEAQRTWLDRQRFRPAQWGGSRARWVLHEASGGEVWEGFERVRPLGDALPDLALVPLPGHTHGHAGVAVQADGQWLLLAGDAYFHRREMDTFAPWCPPGLRAYQTLMEKDRDLRLTNQARLRALHGAHTTGLTLCCSHDPVEFERLSGRALDALPQALNHPLPA